MQNTWDEIERHIAACTQCPITDQMPACYGTRKPSGRTYADCRGPRRGGRPSGDSVCRALRGDFRQAFAGLRADRKGDLHYQHFKMSSSGQP